MSSFILNKQDWQPLMYFLDLSCIWFHPAWSLFKQLRKIYKYIVKECPICGKKNVYVFPQDRLNV